MANFGVTDLRVVNPYEVAFREAVSAVGGAHVLQSARVFGTVAEAVADCTLVVGTTAAQRRDLKQPVDLLAAAAPTIRAHAGRLGLMFGSEKFGLSNEDMSFCHSLVRIPTGEGTPSMNLGQAVAVCLYELAGRSDNVEPKQRLHDPAEGAEVENLTRMLLEVLDRSGYTNRITSTSTEQKIRRWIRRTHPSQHDAKLMLGILRQILWKLNQ
jgi:TrmH family RNA methyltransferase